MMSTAYTRRTGASAPKFAYHPAEVERPPGSMASESRSAVPRGHVDPDYRVVIALREVTLRLGEAFFGPLIGRIVGIMNGFEPQERKAISRFLTAVIDAVPAS
jgi:hypothetical protein